MDPALRQISIRRDRRPRPSPRAHLATPAMAQRLLLRRRALNSPLPLPLPLLAHLHPQSVDPRRDGVPALQPHLFVVRARQLLHRVRDPLRVDGGQVVQFERDRGCECDIELFLSGVVDDVFYPEFGESAAGE